MAASSPGDNYHRIRESLPPEVELVVAAKTRSAAEVAEVVAAGARLIGDNYVQEAEARWAEAGGVPDGVEPHLIGHLQRNKVRRALGLFRMIESVDSARLGRAIDKRAEGPVPVLVEVNVGGEATKSGVPPEETEELVRALAALPNLDVRGLMTMEPPMPDPDDARPYFRRMRGLFARLRDADVAGARMAVLSMGMTHSYRVAVEEGATMVRVGTAIFGPREG